MPDTTVYIIDNTDNTQSFAIQPRTFDGYGGVQRNTDLTLQGNGMPEWGELQNENFYRMMENFACEDKDHPLVSGVPKDESDLGAGHGINFPITGQQWFNKTNETLYVYNGTSWTVSGGSSITAGLEADAPVSAADGDLYYATDIPQLLVYDNNTLPLWDSVASRYVLRTGDSMSGALSILDITSPSTVDLLRLEAEHGPTLNLKSTSSPGSSNLPPAVVWYNPDNDGVLGGAFGTHGYFRIANRDGTYFQFEADTNDIDANFGGGTKVLLQANQSNDELVYFGTDVRAPNATVTLNDHLTTKEYVDNATGGGSFTPIPLTGKTFVPSQIRTRIHLFNDVFPLNPGVPGSAEHIVDLTLAGIIPPNATHVVVRTYLNSNLTGNQGLSVKYRKFVGSGTYYTAVQVDAEVGTTPPSYEGENWASTIEEFDTTTNQLQIRIEDSRGDAGATSSDEVFTKVYVDGWFIDDSAVTPEYIPTNVTFQRELKSALAGNPVVSLTTMTYTVGFDTLQVYLNGQKMISGVDFIETSPTTFNWVGVPLKITDVLECFSAEPIGTVGGGSDESNSFRNALINGNFDFWQRRSQSDIPITAVLGYTADRWCAESTGEECQVRRSTDVPDSGSEFSLEFESNIIDVVPTTTARVSYIVPKEDFRKFQFGGSDAKTMALSFWVKNTISGTYCISLRSNYIDHPASTFSYVAEYTINTADTWEYKTISIPEITAGGGLPWVSGEWSMIVDFWLKGDGTTTGPVGGWYNQAGGATNTHTASQTNFCASGAATFKLSRVQLEPNSVTSFDYRPISVEQNMCHRFYQKTYNAGTDPGTVETISCISCDSEEPVATAVHNTFWDYSITMRKIPNIRVYSPITGASSFNGVNRAGTINSSLDGEIDVEFVSAGDSRVSVVALVSTPPGSGLRSVFSSHFTAEADIWLNHPIYT